jgi:hypothetical protein
MRLQANCSWKKAVVALRLRIGSSQGVPPEDRLSLEIGAELVMGLF